MEKTLEQIEKIWILIGTLGTLFGLTNNFPWFGEVFTEMGWQAIYVLITAAITAYQFFRGKVQDTEIVVGGEVLPTRATGSTGDFRTLGANVQVPKKKLNTVVRHIFNPFSKRVA